MSVRTMENVFRLSLKIYASVILVIALMHGIWHWFFPTYIEMRGLTNAQWNLILIFNWAVVIFFLVFSILSFGIGKTKSVTLNQLRVFSSLMIGFWICRLVLEFIFPVQIPLGIIPNPSPLLKIFIIVVIAILALPEIRLQLRRKSER